MLADGRPGGSGVKVNEIYATILGESSHAGRPCVLVRFAGCSLRCSYCDTEYAFYEGEELSVEEVAERVASFRLPLVLLTGGEPLEQRDLPHLVRALLERDHEVMVETSGALSIEDLDRRATIIMDIKCPGSGVSGTTRWENIAVLRRKDQVKFVISDREDYEWSRRMLGERLASWEGTILFSLTHGRLPPSRLAEWIVEDRLPVRLQLQLHRVIWPDRERGV
jgi:7-carboxy-7-deazaguanine synthase